MKDKKIESLLEKYEAGETTLKEEQYLFENADNTTPALEAWSSFVLKDKKKLPENFHENLWESFNSKKSKKHKYMLGLLSSAATIALFITVLLLGNPNQKELSYSEKEALLKESLKMVASTEEIDLSQDIIYENDFIIIYTKDE